MNVSRVMCGIGVLALMAGACTSTSGGGPVSTLDGAVHEPLAILVDGSGQPVQVEVVAAEPNSLPELPTWFNPAGSGVEVRVQLGVVTEPVSMSVPGDAPPLGELPVLLHRTAAGVWEPDPAEYSDGRYTAVVSSFSLRIPGSISPEFVLDSSDNAFDWLTGRTDQPADCYHQTEQSKEPYGWVATQLSGPADGSFHACVRANPVGGSGVERVEVIIKSNRSMAMWVTIPGEVYDYLWIEGLTDWERIAPVITELDQAFGPNRVLLPPGRTMTVGYTRPTGAGPRLEFSTFQTTTTELVSLAYRYLGDLGLLGATVAGLWCMVDLSAQQARDVRLSELPAMEVAGCLLDFVLGATGEDLQDRLTLLRLKYADMVAQGRMELSAAAGDGVERLLNDADTVLKVGRILKFLKSTLAGVTALQLTSDFVTMTSDTLLAFGPGLNTYTVFLVGAAGEPVTTTVSPEETPQPPSDLFPLRLGSQGDNVRSAQGALASLGFLSVNGVDGAYGPMTEGAVNEWKRIRGEALDGQLSQFDFDNLALDAETGVDEQWVPGRSVQIWACEEFLREPESFNVGCTSSVFTDITWTGWGDRRAFGAGTLMSGSTPETETSVGVSIELTDPVEVWCGDYRYVLYATLIVTVEGSSSPTRSTLPTQPC